jgi:hypothetical protein
MKNSLYGGRIDSEHDLRVLVTYVRKLFAPDVLSGGPSLQPAKRKVLPVSITFLNCPTTVRKNQARTRSDTHTHTHACYITKQQGGMEIPFSVHRADYIKLIGAALPDQQDPPMLFDLPPNVEGAVQQAAAQFCASQLARLSTFSLLNSRQKFDRDTWRAQLAPVLGLWAKLSGATLLAF